MEKNNAISPDHLPGLGNKIDAIHNYLKNTFSETRNDINEGFILFRGGITDKLNKTGSYIKNDLVLPVNNFIKDITQIDKEFEEECMKNGEYCICLDGKMVPADEVLTMSMEEN